VTDPFGRGGGERYAAEKGIDFLGGVPLDITVRQGADVGVPAVAQTQPGPAAAALDHVARAIAGKASVQASREQPVLTVS
jgi:ATP-binding protein involved in chromosome partitioning